jgi:hypothetical protein
MPLALDMRFTAPAWTTLALVDHLGWHPSVPHRRLMAALYAIRPLDRKPSNPGTNSFTSPNQDGKRHITHRANDEYPLAYHALNLITVPPKSPGSAGRPAVGQLTLQM